MRINYELYIKDMKNLSMNFIKLAEASLPLVGFYLFRQLVAEKGAS